MAVLEGFITDEDFKSISKRTDCTILCFDLNPQKRPGYTRMLEGQTWIRLDCDWSIIEFLGNYDRNDGKCLLKGCGGKLEYYDGALGYEAMVCKKCKAHHTNDGVTPDNSWGK